MATYHIAVLGAGNIGGSLGRKWLKAGHTVQFGVRDTLSEKTQTLRTEIDEHAKIGTIAQAIEGSGIIVFALPGGVMEQTIAAHASNLNNKIIIDATNNIQGSSFNSLASFQAHTPNAHVYRAFNIYGWENFVDPIFNGVQADLFYSGPAGENQLVVEQLISAIGLQPMRVGDTDQAGVVDSLLKLWFNLSVGQGKGRNFAFKVLTR